MRSPSTTATPATIVQLPTSLLERILVCLLSPVLKETKFRQPVTNRELSDHLSPDSYKDIVSFRRINHRFKEVYENRFGPSRICKLPEEILVSILECNTHIKKDLVATTKKASLSVESFAVPVPSRQDLNEVANFRLVCRKFAKHGLDCQFARVITRFSPEGFERLRWVATRPKLATKVKQFSYLVPRLHTQERRCFEEMLREAQSATDTLSKQLGGRRQIENGRADQLQPTNSQLEGRIRRSQEYETRITHMITKLDQQNQIIDRRADFEELLHALTSFKNLQQVRFMKIVNQMDDTFDTSLTKFLETHPIYPPLNRGHEWNLTCEHSAKTLTEALFASNLQHVKRLSSRFIDPRTPLSLTATSRAAILAVAKRLNSLELDFDNRVNLNEKVGELSEIFKIVFTEAINLQNLHVGFRRTVSIPVETVFHHVAFEGLNYLGLHQWELEGEELIDLVLRHKKYLRYLRLRYVRLRQGKWGSVLKAIRLNLNLSWVSLRGVDYPLPELGGMVFPPAPPGPFGLPVNPNDGEDDESDLDDQWAGSGDEDTDAGEIEERLGGEHIAEDVPDEDSDDDNGHDDTDQSEDRAESDDENESVLGHAVRGGSGRASPLLHHPGPVPGHLNEEQQIPPRPEPGRCYCTIGYGWNDLVDNGMIVEQTQWRFWQEWVTRRCHIHDPDAAREDPDFE